MKSRWNDLVSRFKNMDLYVVRGVPSSYRPGMKLFWWYGFFIAMSSAFVDSYVTLYALAMGATDLQVGTLASLSSLLATIAPIPGAQWAARWGTRKWVVVISFGARRVALLCAALIPFFFTGQTAVYLIIGLMALRAGLSSLGSPAWGSFAGDLVPINRRGRYFSARKTVMAISSLIFVWVAGQVISAVYEPLGYQVAFGISVLVGAFALTMYARLPEKTAKNAEVKTDKSIGAFWKALISNRTFLLYTLFSIVFQLAWQMAGPYFGVYQVKELGATPQIVSIISMVSALTRVAGQQVMGRLVDQRGSQWVFVVCLLIIPALPLLWLPMTNAWHVLIVAAPSGFLWAGRELGNFNLQLELSDEERRTQAIASYSTIMGLANIVGPLIGGQIISAWGYKWTFALSGIGRFMGALLLLALLKPFARKRPATA